jgi:pimeloyl-ACP methyl ester carboxylesterase
MKQPTRHWIRATLAAVLLLGVSLSHAATPVPPGKWRFEFTDAKGRPDRAIRVYTYRPKSCDASCPIMFVLHGMQRDGSKYRDYWELLADRHKLLIVAPEFSRDQWPKAAAYNLGDVAEQANPEKWSYSVIEHLFDEVRVDQKTYAIFGHSAGGQFVQRMALLRPDNRAFVMVAANPGWYLMPEWRKEKTENPYPYSLVGSKVGEKELRQALERRFILLVGEKDNDPDDENLNKSAGAMKQGETRVERGENFIKAATTAARDLGLKLAWQFIEVPDVAHDGNTMSKIAAETLYGKK